MEERVRELERQAAAAAAARLTETSPTPPDHSVHSNAYGSGPNASG